MNKLTALALLVLALAGAAAIVLERRAWGAKHESPTGPASAAAPDAGAPAADAGESAAAPTAEPVEAEGTEAGMTLLDGGRVPELGPEAPKEVEFGVVLVGYAGAQGARRDARSRAAALRLAGELLALARSDFAAAVAKGDQGSTAAAGRMPRGVLEPAPEHVLFSLGKGEIGGPVDTPRGFWIVKRIE
ncbi:MAG: peptidylprolyl isomerase [Deltaproteobacteria bacterium]|nr:peptidylprolyl isomerase [Deltaproteobacteria bacterium]